MPEFVSRDEIDRRVVRDWAKMVREEAQHRGDDLSTIIPFPPYPNTFSDIMDDINYNTSQGRVFYQKMVRLLPGYCFVSQET